MAQQKGSRTGRCQGCNHLERVRIERLPGLPPGCAMPDCASRPASRTSITEPHAASTALCSRSSPMASGSERIPKSGRRQALAVLEALARSHPEG